MTHLQVEATAKNFPLGWRITAEEFDGDFINPTALTVQIVLSTTTEPGGGTYKAAAWHTNIRTTPDSYWAVLEVSGPSTGGTNEYPTATYHAFAEIIDGTREIVLPLGLVTIG